MRYDPEHRERTHVRILEEAGKVLLAHGADRLSLAGVMNNAGLTNGGFYAHFKSRDGLIAAAVGHLFAKARAIFDRLTSGKSAAEGLSAYISWYLSPHHRDMRDEGCPIAALAGDQWRLHATARRQYVKGAESMMAKISKLLRQLGHADPKGTSASVFAELVGAILFARAVGDDGLSESILRKSRVRLHDRLAVRRA